MSTKIFVLLTLFAFSVNVRAADCADIFPDSAQSSSNGGGVYLYWNSRLFNSPDNVIDTRNFYYSGPFGQSCDGVDCTQSGSVVPVGDYNNFPNGQPDVYLGYQQTQTISPGSYDDIRIGTDATLYMEPGVYEVRGNFIMDYLAELVVTGPGTVTIYVRLDIVIGTSATVNSANSDRYVFLFSRRDIFLYSYSNTNAIIYSRDDVILSSGAEVTGAVTARDDIVLQSASYISYDSNAAINTDYGSGFCTPSTPPSLIAEWRLDELQWSGTSGEVTDSSGNNLHGTARSVGNLYPETQRDVPAVAGDPGTCRSGNFAGVNDGYVQINDPGTNSVLDLTAFTVSAWIYPRRYADNSIDNLMTIASKDENWEFHVNTFGRIYWWWRQSDGRASSLTSSSPVTLNAWQHVAITYESGQQYIYLNGALVATGNSTSGVFLNNDPVLIGTDLNFFNSRNFDGYIDEVRIYDGPLTSAEIATVMSETHICIPEPSLDHFDIDVGAGFASTCQPKLVTITARTSSNAVATDYTGTVDIRTSTNNGNWSKSGTPTDALGDLISGANDSGSASYAFESAGNDSGSIKLNLANEHAETLTITVTDSTEGVISTSADLTFSENAFVVTNTDSHGDDVIAARPHQFQVKMLREDPTTGECGVSTEYDTASVKAWFVRESDDPGGAGPTLVNANASFTTTLPEALPANNNITLPFVDGVADFSLTPNDVGHFNLLLRDDSLTFSDQPIIGGTSSSIIARPFGFRIDVTGNPGAVDANGSVFTRAGAVFTVGVTAVGWDIADDADNNGQPDGHDNSDPGDNANLSDNLVLNRFGQEVVAPADAETITLTAEVFAPSAGGGALLSSSTIGDGRVLASFTNGAASTSTVYFSDVGIIELQAAITDGSYLNSTAAYAGLAASKSGYVGRFTPAYYQLVSTEIDAACGTGLDFSYMGQIFELAFDIEAKNAQDVTTVNYEADFVKLSNSVGTMNVGARDMLGNSNLSSRMEAPSGGSHYIQDSGISWSAGVGGGVSLLRFMRSAAPDGPYGRLAVGATLTDSDGISLRTADLDLDVDADGGNDYVSFGETEVRFGRVRLDDAFGPETANIPVNFLAEYWDGRVWRTNADDSCTEIALSAITYPGGAISSAANRTVTVGAGATTGNYDNITATGVVFEDGDAGAYFTAPGAGNVGSFQVDVDLTLYPWLLFDWNNDGDYTNDTSLPSATFTFGSYRGHDRVIYWQEVLQ